MKFEVYGQDKKRKAHTESERCIPDEQTLKQMKAAGYTILIDGKRWRPGNEKANRRPRSEAVNND